VNATPNRRRSRAAAVTLLAAVAVTTVGAGAASAAPGFNFGTRLAGPTRVDTAVKASQWLYPDGTTSDDVIIVNREAFVDGMAASYLAGLRNAPILFTDRDTTPDATKAEMTRLGVKHVWIAGGTAVVSQGLEDAWKSSGLAVTRYAGDDRYGTAAKIAAAGPYQPERVYIVSGNAWADALAAGPVAFARNYPILLTRKDSVPDATAKALAAMATRDRTVLGGTAVVSDPTAAALGATKRLGGADRQGTAVKVADDAVLTADFTKENAALVGGSNNSAADALVASPIAGTTGTPLLFISGNDAVGTTTRDYLRANRVELEGEGYVLGGTTVVTDTAVAQAEAAAQ
jgi:putative cell wall-binding protein